MCNKFQSFFCLYIPSNHLQNRNFKKNFSSQKIPSFFFPTKFMILFKAPITMCNKLQSFFVLILLQITSEIEISKKKLFERINIIMSLLKQYFKSTFPFRNFYPAFSVTKFSNILRDISRTKYKRLKKVDGCLVNSAQGITLQVPVIPHATMGS